MTETIQHTIRGLARAGLVLGAALAASPAGAHHSYAAFDSAHTRTLDGVVENFDWSNPHVSFKIRLMSPSGAAAEQWSIESHGPSILMHYGWDADSLTPGARVRVLCNPLRNGAHGCRLLTVTLLDNGRTLETKLSVSLRTRPND